MADPASIVVFISGSGSNLQAILDAPAHGHSYRVTLVVSDQASAYGLTRAHAAGIATRIVQRGDYPERAAFDRALIDAVASANPQLVVLAGFMRILGTEFVNRFRGRLVNIHPSLLPRYKGLDTYRRVLEAGEREHGTSVHFVTEQLDGGPIVAQAAVPIAAGDTVASLSAKVQALEYELYPRVIDAFCRGQIALQDNVVTFNGAPVSAPLDRHALAEARAS